MRGGGGSPLLCVEGRAGRFMCPAFLAASGWWTWWMFTGRPQSASWEPPGGRDLVVVSTLSLPAQSSELLPGSPSPPLPLFSHCPAREGPRWPSAAGFQNTGVRLGAGEPPRGLASLCPLPGFSCLLRMQSCQPSLSSSVSWTLRDSRGPPPERPQVLIREPRAGCRPLRLSFPICRLTQF